MKSENLSQPLNVGQIYPLTVYYDGGCKLCTSEIDNIAARDTLQRLVLVDCNTASFDYSAIGASREAMLNEIHARALDGAWLRGVDVFIAMYHAVNLSSIAKIMAHPYVKPRATAFYPWLVRNRHRLSRLGLHKVLGFFAHTARRNHAPAMLHQAALTAHAASAACRDGMCAVENMRPTHSKENKQTNQATQMPSILPKEAPS